MNLANLTTIVAVLITLSIASERLVEIIKGLVPFLNQENPDALKEGRRRAAIQFLAVVSGVFTAWLASSIPESGIKNDLFAILAFGLLASGGSAFWNSILEYLLKIKDIKEVEAEKRKELKFTEVEKVHALAGLDVKKAEKLNEIEIAKEDELMKIEVEKAKESFSLLPSNN